MRRLGHYGLVILLLWVTSNFTAALPARPASAQVAPDYAAEARLWLSQLTPAERVGQLFLVTFPGEELPPTSDIATLITDYHIGGVVLSAANSNFSGSPQNLPTQVHNLTTQLQTLALTGQLLLTNTAELTNTAVFTPTFPPTHPIPLLIAPSGTADLQPALTEQPSQMALGATWNPTHAQQSGQLLGQELTGLGFNLFFGPSLNVIETPQLAVNSHNQLGTAVFGGSPYWVSLLGQAYITGLQEGSHGRLAIMPTHFPGAGSSDRAGYLEIATVRKSLVELQQSDLVPFAAVTQGNAPVDGLLAAHIRYQGFQGNIRASTPPVSFDPQALEGLLRLGQLPTWRANGGLITSNPLGVPAIERFYDDTGQIFPHRQVAKDALLAGNDLLYVGEFGLGDDPASHLENVRDTIIWFQEKYETDPAFQQRVDEAVWRILALKLRLYEGDLSLGNILPTAEQFTQVGHNPSPAFAVAQEGLTLLFPTAEELLERLPGPPTDTDQLVIFTDVRLTQACPTCPATAPIGREVVAERILALYGPQGSGQMQASQLQSFAFDELQLFLDTPGPILPPATPTPIPTPEKPEGIEVLITPEPVPTTAVAPPPSAYNVQEAISTADWFIFAMLDVQPGTASAALKNLLAQRPDLLRNKRIIVLAFDAPYYLDTTEVSKLTAYMGVYGTGASGIDAAVRALFRDATLRGASPVTVEGVGYNLRQALAPASNQIIPLNIELDGELETPQDGSALELLPGATLRLRTGIIHDRNGRPVPDGTLVQFTLQDRTQGFFSVIGEVPTREGVAGFDYVLEARVGQFRITAATGQARTSEEVNIAIGENISIVVLSPTPEPTATHTPIPTTTPTPTPLPSPTATSSPTPTPLPPSEGVQVAISWPQLQHLAGLVGGLVLVGGTAEVLNRRRGRRTPSQKLAQLLWGVLGGLLAYNYVLWALPGTAVWLSLFGTWATFWAILFGGLVGLLAGRKL